MDTCDAARNSAAVLQSFTVHDLQCYTNNFHASSWSRIIEIGLIIIRQSVVHVASFFVFANRGDIIKHAGRYDADILFE